MAITESIVLEELRVGETGRVEFKSTLRWNLKTNRLDDAIIHAAMKAIAGLMNKNGGTVYIGVDDFGTPRGLGEDGYKNDDKFRRLLVDTMKRYLGQLAAVAIRTSFHEINAQKILRVECPAAKQPVYLNHNNREEFWVRAETETIQLPVSQIHRYITERFGQTITPIPDDTIPQVEFREVIRALNTPAVAFRRFAQDVQRLVARGKWVFNIGIGEPAEMAEAEKRLHDSLDGFREAVLAARQAAAEVRDGEAVDDCLVVALERAERLNNLVGEVRHGLDSTSLEKDERYLGFLEAAQLSVVEIRRRLAADPSRRDEEPRPAVASPRVVKSQHPATDYWSMDDTYLEKLAAKYNIPPWSRAGKDGEHWYVDRDRIIATLVERDRHLSGTVPPTAKTSSVPPLRVPASQAANSLSRLALEGTHLFDDANRFTAEVQERFFEWLKKVGEELEALYWSADVADRFRSGGGLWLVNDLSGLRETAEAKLSILEAIRAELRKP
jgi:hypothetical protein